MNLKWSWQVTGSIIWKVQLIKESGALILLLVHLYCFQKDSFHGQMVSFSSCWNTFVRAVIQYKGVCHWGRTLTSAGRGWSGSRTDQRPVLWHPWLNLIAQSNDPSQVQALHRHAGQQNQSLVRPGILNPDRTATNLYANYYHVINIPIS